MCIVGDDLYGHEPLIEELQGLRMSFVLVAKPTSHAALFAQLAEREQRGECVRGTWAEGTGRHRRTFAYRSAADCSPHAVGSRCGSISWKSGSAALMARSAITIRG